MEGPPPVERGKLAPGIVGTTLEGASFDLADLRGKPVIVNFWGPSCVPCRDEFPLFLAKLDEHSADGLTIVGVLMHDPPAPALDFIREFGATWATVDDPSGEIRTTYRAIVRPMSYFIDSEGILQTMQLGEVTAEGFEQKYAQIRPGAPSGSPTPTGR